MTTAPIAGNQHFTGVSDLAAQVPELNVASLTVASLTADTLSANVADATLLSSGGAVANTMLVGTVNFADSTLDSYILVAKDSAGNPLTLPEGSRINSLRFKEVQGTTMTNAYSFKIALGNGVEGTAGLVGGATEFLVEMADTTHAKSATGGLVAAGDTGTTAAGKIGDPAATGDQSITLGQARRVGATYRTISVYDVGTAVGNTETGVLEITVHYDALRS